MVKLDSLDKKILVELDINSRRPLSQIAKRIRASKNVVNYRINRLIKLGIIQGFYTVIDTVKLGYYNFRAYIRLREADTREKQEIIGHLVKEKRTWWVVRTSSPWDIAIILLAKDLHEAKKIMDGFVDKYKKKIQCYQFVPYTELKHFPKTYLTKSMDRPAFTLGNEKRVEVNDLEWKILKELSKNARLGTVELAKRINSTPMVVSYAIKKLIANKIFLGFRVLLDYDKIGYEYYWIHLNVSSNRQNISSFVQSLSNTVYFDETIGGWDVEFALHIEKQDHIDSWLDKIFKKFGGSITEHSYFRIIKNEKVSYLPQD